MNIDYYYGSLTRCASSWREIDVTYVYSKFYYILDGACIIEVNGEKYEGKKGRLFLIPAGTKHSFYHYNHHLIKKYWFHFSLESDGLAATDFPYYIDVGLDKSIIDIFKNILSADHNSMCGQLIQKSNILELTARYFSLAEIDTAQASGAPSEVLQHISGHLNSRLSIAILSEIAHLQPNYFIRLFKKRFGMPPLKYINQLKIEHAKFLLEHTAIPITDIMQNIGFDDLSHFSRFFKQHTGCAPRKFRAQYK